MQRNYVDSITVLQAIWLQADLDQRTAMGDQDIWNMLYPGTANMRRKTFNFNIVNSIIQSVSGQQRSNRKSTIAIPVHNAGQKTADQLTKCLYYVHNQGGLYQVYSDAFEQGALVQGSGYIGLYMDKTEDISGEIKARYIDTKSILTDPFYRQKDLSDCRFIWTRQFFDKHELAFLYPQFADRIMQQPGGTYRDDKFYFMPEVYLIQSINVVAFDEYWYQSTREAIYLVDVETNEIKEFTGDEEDLRVIKSKFKDRLKIVKRPKQTVRRALLINDNLLVDEPNPYGLDRYPFVPVLGYFTPDTPYYAFKFRGMVRDMRDAQYLLNRRKVADLDILESQQQGLMVEEGSLVTPDDSMNTGHGRVLVRKKGTDPSAVTPMEIHPPSPVMLQMEEMLKEMTYHISGIDPQAMGIDVDDKAGIITMMRSAASTRNLVRLFDQFDYAQELCGQIIIEMIQKNWTYAKVADVLGEEPVPEFDDEAFFKYNAKVAQGLLTESQKQLELAQLLELQTRFPDIFPMDEIIDCMTIQNKDRIIEKMTQQMQAQQQQQQQMSQLQMQQMQIDNEMKLAYADSERGKADERRSKAELDQFDAIRRIHESEAEDARAKLDIVRSLKELESLDLKDLSTKIDLLSKINSLSFSEELPQTKQNVNLTNEQGVQNGME